VSRLRFQPLLHSWEVGSAALPVEVRTPDLGLVGTALTTGTLKVEPGSYHVTARLPAGQELSGSVDVARGKSATVELTLDPGHVSPHETEELQRFVWGVEPASNEAALRALAAAAKRPLRLIPYDGNPLAEGYGRLNSRLVEFQPRPDEGAPETLALSVGGPVNLIQLHRPGADDLNAVIPGGPFGPPLAWIVVRPDANGSVGLMVRPTHATADALLGFGEHNLISETAELAGGGVLQAEELLRGKRRDPVAAAAGAYALLRVGELERLHDWTRNLERWVPWLADGVVIRAEHLVRLREDKNALAMLLTLERRGLPLFTEGLTLAVKRLRRYVAAGTAIPKTQTRRAARLLERLSEYATFADFSQPTLTFYGGNPNRPGSPTTRSKDRTGYNLAPLIEQAREELRRRKRAERKAK
jgi:hypothetical protein